VHTEAQANDGMKKLAELIGAARIAMLATLESNGSLRSRPLATLELDSSGRLWFFTSVSAPKIEEIAHHKQVNLSYSDPDKQDYVSISGPAELVRDRARMRSLWTAWVEPWFPRGVDDPDLALLCVQIEQAEYWDAPESRMQRMFGLAKAIATGDTRALGEHQKLSGPAH
jgi:general stress protein 26